MRTYENVKDVALLSLSLSLSFVYFNLWPDSPEFLAIGGFLCFSPFFAWLFRNVSRHFLYLSIVSAFYFVSLGIVISSHFGIDSRYGAIVGFCEFAVLLSVIRLWRRTHTTVDGTLLCLVWLTWVSVDYIVAYFYGIAFLPPIQLFRFPFVIQPISLLGFSFIDAFVIGINILIGVVLASLMGGRPCVPTCHRRYTLFAFFSIASWILLCAIACSSTDISNLPSVRMSTISPGKKFEGNLDDIVGLTSDASKVAKSQFIVWPELYINPRHTSNKTCEQYIREEVMPRLLDIDSYIVVGCDEHTDHEECPFGNLAFTISPKGSSILGSYGKQHPVTMIGERSCIRNGYHVYKVDEDTQVNGLRVPGDLAFSTLICYDMDFADSAAHVADSGAHFILNPSEDWTAARGHFAASVFRAVENRVSVAKCDWGWDSVIIDPYGNLRASFATEEEHRQVLTADVPIWLNRSGWYFLRQNVFPLLCIFTLLVYVTKNLAKPMHMSSGTSLSDIEARLVGNNS